MILCVGTDGCGKSMLLKILQQYGVTLVNTPEAPADAAGATAAPVPPAAPATNNEPVPTPIPTVGTDLVTLTRPSKGKQGKNAPMESAVIREVGGAMAPLWSSYIEPGRTKAILYVIDASCPEMIGPATIHLVELLGHTTVESASVLIVFTKTDIKSSRTLSELKSLMRLDHIITTSSQNVKEMTFHLQKRETVPDIFSWCMQFQVQQQEAGLV